MSMEVHLDWKSTTHLVGSLHTAARSPVVSFKYAPEWIARAGAFAIDPTALPLRPGPQLRVKASTLDAHASAFEHPLMDEAKPLIH